MSVAPINTDDLSHPESIIKLVATTHKFRCPEVGSRSLSYVRSFKTISEDHAKTLTAMQQADAARTSLVAALAGARSDSSSTSTSTVSYESVARAAKDYAPCVQQILLSCEVQPDTARLDERLLFEWTSGVEMAKKRKTYKSEALTYEVAMAVACQGLGTAGMASDEGNMGNYAAASKHFKLAAGLFEFLAQDQLPKWVARGSDVRNQDLPCESTAGVCEALKLLFLAYAQQMAVATMMAKSGLQNYSLLAKLCLGTAEQLDHAVGTFKAKAADQAAQFDVHFFKLVAFQTALQRSLSSYFLARSYWDQDEYGVAISVLNEAMELSKSFPATDKRSGLAHLNADVTQLRNHFTTLHKSWERDNSAIFFSAVPRYVPKENKLEEGMSMMKVEPHSAPDLSPLPLFEKVKKKSAKWW